jgi:uncharacterized membrane protein
MQTPDRAKGLFDWLDYFGITLAAFQIAMAISMLFADQPLDGLSGLIVATVVVIAANRKILLDRANVPAAPWIAAMRGALLLFLTLATGIVAADRFLPQGISRTAAPDATDALIGLLVMLGWFIIALKGAMVGKLRPNRFVGLRLRWNRQSRLAWDRSHRLWGRILFPGALGGLVTSPVLPWSASIIGLVLLIVCALIAAAIESHRAWSADPERQST